MLKKQHFRTTTANEARSEITQWHVSLLTSPNQNFPHGWPEFAGEWMGSRNISITKCLACFQLLGSGELPCSLGSPLVIPYQLLGAEAEGKPWLWGFWQQLSSDPSQPQVSQVPLQKFFPLIRKAAWTCSGTMQSWAVGLLWCPRLPFGSPELVTKWMLRHENP